MSNSAPFAMVFGAAVTVVAVLPLPNTYMYPSYMLPAVRYPSATAPGAMGPVRFQISSPVVALIAKILQPLWMGCVGVCSVLYVKIFPSATRLEPKNGYSLVPLTIEYGLSNGTLAYWKCQALFPVDQL